MKYRSTKEERFDSIYRAYADEIYKLCLHLTKNHELAQDIAQQTFLQFYDHLEEVNPDCIYGYLARIAKNLIYNHERDSKYEIPSEARMFETYREENISDSLEEDYFRGKQRNLEEMLSNHILSDLKREHESWYKIITMLYFLDKTHDEISEEMGITKDVLYSRMYRAKRWIHKHYQEEFENITDMV